MAKNNPYRPYSPNAEFKALLGSYNGNTVNGLGETTLRAPSMVWWTPDMADADFGEAQMWFYQQEKPDEEMTQLRHQRHQAVADPLPAVALKRRQLNPEELAKGLQQFVDSGDCEMTGATPLQAEWVFDHETTELPTSSY